MKRALPLVSLLALALVLGLGSYRYFSVSSDDPPEFALINPTLEPLPCDLNLGACDVVFEGKKLSFELSPRPIYAMREATLSIIGLSELGINQAGLEIYGLNMDMGVIRADGEMKEGVFSSKIVLSACVVSVMRYRMQVVSGGKRTGIFIDFDLKI